MGQETQAMVLPFAGLGRGRCPINRKEGPLIVLLLLVLTGRVIVYKIATRAMMRPGEVI